MALNALWPLLAQAAPARNSGSVVEICTAKGMKWIAAERSEKHPAQRNLAPHGAFCTLGAERAPLPSSPAIVPVRVSTVVALVVPGETARVVSQSCFSAALARAPPALS